MDNSKQSKQVLLSVIGVAILVVAVVGVSFAFFNYTRTGTANTVSTGKIKFNSTQSGAAELTNVFPLTAAQLTTELNKTNPSHADYDENYHPNFAEVTVNISGETTYSGGLDYQVIATGVDFDATADGSTVTLPVRVEVTQTGNLNGGSGDTCTLYQYTTTTPLAENNPLAVGHIAPTADVADFTGTRVSGTVVVRMYIDASKVAITDTLQGGTLTPSDGSVNGTTGNPGWVGDRVRLTTEQWNSLSTDTLRFSIRVESIEAGGSYLQNRVMPS